MIRKLLLRAFYLTLATAAVPGCGSSAAAPSTGSTGNHAPVIAGIDSSTTGFGVQSVTSFLFAARGASDPDGDALTYVWTSTDGGAFTTSGSAAGKVFTRTGNWDVKVTVTDPAGLSSSSTVSVTIGTLTGTWDIVCAGAEPGILAIYPTFPKQFVATITQFDSSLAGSLSAAGKSHSINSFSNVTTPRSAIFGVENADNVWAPHDGDFYFHLTASDTLTTMSGSGGSYCGASTAVKR